MRHSFLAGFVMEKGGRSAMGSAEVVTNTSLPNLDVVLDWQKQIAQKDGGDKVVIFSLSPLGTSGKKRGRRKNRRARANELHTVYCGC